MRLIGGVFTQALLSVHVVRNTYREKKEIKTIVTFFLDPLFSEKLLEDEI